MPRERRGRIKRRIRRKSAGGGGPRLESGGSDTAAGAAAEGGGARTEPMFPDATKRVAIILNLIRGGRDSKSLYLHGKQEDGGCGRGKREATWVKAGIAAVREREAFNNGSDGAGGSP